MRSGGAARWIVEALVPALAVFLGLSLFMLAAVARATDGLDRGQQVRLFLLGVGCWAGGIAWGAVVNRGAPGLLDP